MALTNDSKNEAMSTSMLIKEQLEPIFKQHNIHAGIFAWVSDVGNSHDMNIATQSVLMQGCQECIGRALALMVINCNLEQRAAFITEIGNYFMGKETEVVRMLAEPKVQ